MEFFRVLFKILAVLLGLPLTLGGFVGFWWGVYKIIGGQNVGVGIVIGSILALTIGTILGKFARGDYGK